MSTPQGLKKSRVPAFLSLTEVRQRFTMRKGGKSRRQTLEIKTIEIKDSE